MAVDQFFKQLFVVVFISFVLVFVLNWIPAFSGHLFFSSVLTLVFALLCIVIYLSGNKIASSKNKYLYNNLIIINFALKIMLSFIAVFSYVKLTEPQDHNYLIAFVLLYIIFTAFEVYFMSIQAKAKR